MKSERKLWTCGLIVAAMSACATCADASVVLSGNLTGDNLLEAYISNSPYAYNTPAFALGYSPFNTYSGAQNLSNTAQYLLVVVRNSGGPGGFLGDFHLSDASLQFANGTQDLLTGDSAWQQATFDPGLGSIGSYLPTVDEGPNGVVPWGFHNGINANARWIWSRDSTATLNSGDNNTIFFATAITVAGQDGHGSVPEPDSTALVGLSLTALVLSRRRKSGT